jgi:O-antigen ligase
MAQIPMPSSLEVGVDGVFFSDYSGIDLIRGFRVSIFGLGPVLTAAIFLVLFILSFTIKFKDCSAIWFLRLLILFIIFLTDSRAALAIAFIFILLYGVYGIGGFTPLFFGALFMMGLGAVFYDEISYKLLYRFGEVDYSTLYHLAVWESAYWIFDDNKLFGVGLGEFVGHWIVPEFHRYYSLSFNDIDPHNIFLKLMAETGVLGTGLFGLFILFTILKINLNDENSFLVAFSFGALLLMNMTMNAFFVEFFWISAALCAARKRDFSRESFLSDDLTVRRNCGEYR